MGKLARPKQKAKAKPKTRAKQKAKAKPKAKTRSVSARLSIPRTDKSFVLQDFIKELFSLAQVKPKSHGSLKIKCASACTGTNSFGITARRFVREMQPAVEVADLFGSDWSKAAQTFVIRNGCAPHHLFDATWLCACKFVVVNEGRRCAFACVHAIPSTACQGC